MNFKLFNNMPSNSAKVLQFMEVFDQSIGENIFDGRALTLRLLSLRFQYIEETMEELRRAVEEFIAWSIRSDADDIKDISIRVSFVEIVNALATLLFVTYGFFLAFGVDADAALDAVHESNMSKLDEYGRPIYREDGKVLKGPSYQPPNFEPILQGYIDTFDVTKV